MLRVVGHARPRGTAEEPFAASMVPAASTKPTDRLQRYNNNNNNNDLPAYTGPPPIFAEARGARASLDCLMHGPRSGRDACVMAQGGVR